MGVSFKPLSERYDIDERGCWLWNGATGGNGYGQFRVNNKYFAAHRYFYEFFNSTCIPPGMQIDHLCKRKRCCNPDHLEVVTSRENTLRSAHSPTAKNARKTECEHGHPLSGDNLYTSPDGYRRCRVCQKRRRMAWRRKHLS